MSENYTVRELVIADTHWNHEKLSNHCNRPPDVDQRIIRNCRRMLRPTDVVYHIGDCVIGKGHFLPKIMEQLPGTWILIQGNHDHRHSHSWYVRHGFAASCDGIATRGVYLSHFPVEVLPPGCKWNIHGHFHNNEPDRWEFNVYEHSRLLALEHTNYEPILLDKFMKRTKSSLELWERHFGHEAPIKNGEKYGPASRIWRTKK